MKLNAPNAEMAGVHKQLGCSGCYYADKSAIGKRACCTHIKGPLPEWVKKKDGSERCMRRRET